MRRWHVSRPRVQGCEGEGGGRGYMRATGAKRACVLRGLKGLRACRVHSREAHAGVDFWLPSTEGISSELPFLVREIEPCRRKQSAADRGTGQRLRAKCTACIQY